VAGWKQGQARVGRPVALRVVARYCVDTHRNGTQEIERVRVVATTNDMVRLSFLRVLLADAGITAFLLDAHTSAVEGSIGAIPRRLVVAAEDEAWARRVLAEAGEA
jgi:hypothetical protein